MSFFRDPKKLGILAVGLILFYALLGFVIIPLVVEYKLPTVLSEQLGKPVMVKDVALNPFTMTFDMQGFEIQEQDQTPLIGFQELFIDFELSSIFRGSYTFDQIRLVLPYGVIKILFDGRMNLADLATASSSEEPAPPPEPSEETGLPPVDIAHLSIEGGIVEFHDEMKSSPFRADIVPINISLKNFSTQKGSENPYSVTAELTEGEVLNWEGTVNLDPVSSKGKVSVSGLKLRTAWTYLQDLLQFEIADGVLSVSSDYHVETIGENLETTLSSAEVHLKRFALTEKGSTTPLISIPAFDIEGVTVDVPRQRVDIPSISSKDARFVGWLDTDGTVNYQTLFAPNTDQPEEDQASTERVAIMTDSPTPPDQLDQTGQANQPEQTVQPEQPNQIAQTDQPEQTGQPEQTTQIVQPDQPNPSDQPEDAKPWSVTLEKLAIENYSIAFEDRSLESPAQLDLDSLNFEVHGASTDFSKPIDFALSLAINETGTAEVKGDVQIEPMVANVEVAVSKLALSPFQPYVDPLMQLDLLDGAIEIQGKTQYHGAPTDQPMLSYEGQVALNELSLAIRDQTEELLSWDSLAVTEIALQVEPTTVTVGEIALMKPYANVAIGADGAINLAQAFSPAQDAESMEAEDQEEEPKEESKEEPQEESKAEAGPAVPVKINTVKIDNAEVDFADLSLKPNVRMGIQEFTGTIKGLSSEQLTKADVDLKGKVDQYAPIEIKGQINPLSKDAYTDLAFIFKNWGLTGISPYSGKFAGYPISKGKLSLDLAYKVSEHTLEGQNKVLVDQLTMGEEIDSPDAPGLPIPLALALLKDRNGQINIDLPVTGDLNDPEFSYGGIIWGALVNLITKAATSPFAALGNVLGGSGDDLQFVAFAPGETALGEEESEKLLSLAKALEERPGLRLEVTGATDTESDGGAVAAKKLSAQLRQARAQELNGSQDKNQIPPEQVSLTKADELRLLEMLFVQKFGKQAAAEQKGAIEAKAASKPPLTPEEMKTKLLETIRVEEAELRSLAQDRAKKIRDYLIQQGRIPEDRVFLIEVNLNAEIGEESVKSPLTLTAG